MKISLSNAVLYVVLLLSVGDVLSVLPHLAKV
jgi:hypothetical protein